MFLKYFSVNPGFQRSPGCQIPSPWIPDSRSRIPDSKASDSGLHRQKNAGFWIPDSFTWGEQNVPSPVGRDVSFDDPSTKMSFSDAKTLLTLQKSNLYLQQETKIIKSEERRADDPNSGAISTDCSTMSSHRI